MSSPLAALLIPLIATVLSPTVLCGDISLNLRDAKKEITHLYLDFDHTITVDGFSSIVRQIFCRNAKYPDCNCTRLPGGLCNGTDEVSRNEMVTSLQQLPTGGLVNLTKSFGGATRVNLVRSWFQRVRKGLDGNVYIVSTSWFPVTGLQWQIYLKKVSDMLNLGFDLDHIKTLPDLGPGISSDKGAVVKVNMVKNKVAFKDALFADDSGGNIKSAKDVCNTLYLKEKKGMDQTDRDYIETLVNGCCPWANSSPRMVQGSAGLLLAVIIGNVIMMLQ